MKKLLIALLLTACPSAHAVEIMLEQNRAESGSVGYVDLERIFSEYPETLRAQNDFEAEVKSRENQISVKKEEVFALKSKLGRMKQKRQLMLFIAMNSKRPANPMYFEFTAKTMQDLKSEISPAFSNLPEIGPVYSKNFERPREFKLIEPISREIEQAERELSAKERELRRFQNSSEKELLDYENRRSELILGKIYYALLELVDSEKITVVIDKKSMLYGRTAVDLTNKLLKKLRDGKK
ncbi:MAG: OmpH family outer membrane protein [Elusimicrobia bacterium]|nr:OmpH family outer membrane protein [Elusimicrobiota bacterium]